MRQRWGGNGHPCTARRWSVLSNEEAELMHCLGTARGNSQEDGGNMPLNWTGEFSKAGRRSRAVGRKDHFNVY